METILLTIDGKHTYLLLGGLFAAVKSTMSRIIILLFLAGLAPFIVTAFFIYYLVVMHAW